MFLSGAGNADDSKAKNLSSQPSAFSIQHSAIRHLLFAICCNEENQPQAAGFFYYQDSFLLGPAMNSVAGVPGVAAPIFVMPNLRAFSLLQRQPVTFIGVMRWLAGRDHRNPERNVYPSPDCRYVSG